MPSLDAVFRIFDGYSGPMDKVIRRTNKVASELLGASGNTDKFNQKLNATGASAGNASNGLNKLVGTIISFAAAQKGMNIIDEYTNTKARLNLINDGLQTQAELQEKIFASANRSRGVYSDMAGAIARMGILAGESFKSNDELIAFTELVQKSFKVGGASQTEQSSAMLQLSQAMAAGRLQGDEFRSIMENAPMIAEAIAKYTGKSKGDLREMSKEGTITADIIKNAMFMAGNDIETKFKTMPMTFADIWNRIKNGGTQAFAKIMEKVNQLINTEGFQRFINGLIIGFDLLAKAVGWMIDTIINGWDTIGPILAIIGTVWLVYILTQVVATTAALITQAAAWLSVYWPVLLVIGVIALAISAARQFGASWEQIFGFIGGVIGVFVTYFYNRFVYIWNFVGAFVNFLGNVFKNPVASIKALFFDLASNVIGFISTMAKAIEQVINKIPGVEVNISGGLDKFKSKLESASATIKSEAGLVEYVKSKEFMDYSDGYVKGNNIGKNVANTVGGALDKLNSAMSGAGSIDMSKFGTPGSPITVKGKGKGDKVDVNMSDEDLRYLRDIAEREYINKFSTATLAPNIQVSFGDVHETADADKVAGRIKMILQEEIAMTAEGAY